MAEIYKKKIFPFTINRDGKMVSSFHPILSNDVWEILEVSFYWKSGRGMLLMMSVANGVGDCCGPKLPLLNDKSIGQSSVIYFVLFCLFILPWTVHTLFIPPL